MTSASRTKMELHGYKDQSSSSSDDDYSDDEGCGYRLTDLTTFSSSISDLHVTKVSFCKCVAVWMLFLRQGD